MFLIKADVTNGIHGTCVKHLIIVVRAEYYAAAIIGQRSEGPVSAGGTQNDHWQTQISF